MANAKLDLVNVTTQISGTTTSDASGNFRFLSLAPGTYKITAEGTDSPPMTVAQYNAAIAKALKG